MGACKPVKDGTGGPPASTGSEQSNVLPVEIDQTKPMWGQVAKLGPHYWEWVHKAECGRARFFESDTLELLTVSLWWLGPACFLPVVVVVLWHAYTAGDSTLADIASGIIAGFVLWQAHEYGAHRYIFHHETTSPWWISLHFILHGSHHKYPMDKFRCVFPPVPAGALAAIWMAAIDVILPKSLGRPIWVGMVFGFLTYDLVHYVIHVHHTPLPSNFLRVLQFRHNVHHYKNPDYAYGVSSEILDLLMDTN